MTRFIQPTAFQKKKKKKTTTSKQSLPQNHFNVEFSFPFWVFIDRSTEFTMHSTLNNIVIKY